MVNDALDYLLRLLGFRSGSIHDVQFFPGMLKTIPNDYLDPIIEYEALRYATFIVKA